MNTAYPTQIANPLEEPNPGISRRSFVKHATAVGATGIAALGGFVSTASAIQKEDDGDRDRDDHNHLQKGDRAILIAAEIAEALAVTTYSNIINTAPSSPGWRRMIKAIWRPRFRKRCLTIFWNAP